MATIYVSKDQTSIPVDKKVHFYLGCDKAEQTLVDQDFVCLAVSSGPLEFKASFSGWFEEPTSVEKLIMAPGKSMHYQLFFDKKLRLREIPPFTCPSSTTTTSAYSSAQEEEKEDGVEKPVTCTTTATPLPSRSSQEQRQQLRTGILVSTPDKIPTLGLKNMGYSLWIDGVKIPERLAHGQIFIPLEFPKQGATTTTTHTFQASLWPNNTHKFYFVLSPSGQQQQQQQLHYQVWSAAKCIYGARMVGFENNMLDNNDNNKK